MEIRHVEVGEKAILAIKHPQLAEQRPDLLKPAFANNPTVSDSDFPYLFYALEDDRVVGHFMSFPDMLMANRRPFRWAWNLGLYTEPVFRGRGIAEQLVRHQLQEFDRRDMIWGGVFSSPTAIRLYQRLGFHMPGRAKRMCLVRDVRPFLQCHTRSAVAIGLGVQAYNAYFKLAQGLVFRRRPQAEAPYSTEIVERTKFTEVATRSLIRTEKFYWGTNPHWFEARLSPFDKIYLVYRRLEKMPCAFLIVRDRWVENRTLAARYKGFKMMSVMEFGRLNKQPDFAGAITSSVMAIFDKSDAHIAEFVTSSPEMETATRRHGFFPLGAGMSFKFMAPRRSQFPGDRTTLPDWHLTHYCGDGFGFE